MLLPSRYEENRFDANPSEKSMNAITKLFKKTKLDGCFQRYGGMDFGSGWGRQDARNYLESLMQRSCWNRIIVAKVVSCLQHARDIGDEESIIYFSEAKDEGFEYISIDGNNTCSTVFHFLNGHKDLYLKIGRKKVYLADFDEDVQNDIIHTTRITYVELRQIGIREMATLFQRLNTNTQLNRQEWRQARWSILSNSIREIANNGPTEGRNRAVFQHYFNWKGTEQLDKRDHEEMVAQMAARRLDFKSTIAKALDELYENRDELPQETEDNLTNTFNHLHEMIGEPLTKKFSKGMFHNLVDMIDIITIDHSLKILNHEALFAWFLMRHEHLEAGSGEVKEDDQEDQSYKYWTKYCNTEARWNKIRATLEAIFVLDMTWLKQSKIIKVPRTSKDTFTWDQKRSAAIKQKYKTREGQSFDFVDMWTGKMEADHVLSVKDGGKTELSNCEIMFATDNRAKGSRSSEPFFDHQQQREEEAVR